MGNRSSSTAAAAEGDEPPPPPAEKSASYYTMIKNSYQQLVNAIIRPPRCHYDISKLGPDRFMFCGRTITRKDFNLVNPREQRFCCSLWEPIESDRPNPTLPCIVYMHGNSSSRLEGLSVLSLALTLGATLVAFDFAGSGQSDGEYVTLGAFEKDDLQCVVEFLRAGGTTSSIALWGRSMGAATALLHGERDPSIAAMVLDSAFSSLVTLAEEIVELGRKQGLFAPGFLVRMALQFVRSSVLKTAGFDIRTLTPIESAAKCFSPAMLIAAEGDHFVSKSHSEAIMERYGGDKNLVLVDGDHNTARPRFLYDSVGIFLQQTLQIPSEWMLPQGEAYIRRLPWSHVPGVPHAHYTPSVTHVGTKHSMQSPATSPNMVGSRDSQEARRDSEGASATWSDAGGKYSSAKAPEGSAEQNDMSFDEMLALSIMLNEEEDSQYGSRDYAYDDFEPHMDYGNNSGKYTGAYEGADDLDGTVGASAEAERAMQANINNSLFNLMSGGGTGSAGATGGVESTPDLTPTGSRKNGSSGGSGGGGASSVSGGVGSGSGSDIPPTPSKHAQMSASERYRAQHPRPSSSANSVSNPISANTSAVSSVAKPDKLMTPNMTSKHHEPYSPVTRTPPVDTTMTNTTPPNTTPSNTTPTNTTHTSTTTSIPTTHTNSTPIVRGVVVAPHTVTEAVPINDAPWRCTMCTLSNPGLCDTCESCGIMRSC